MTAIEDPLVCAICHQNFKQTMSLETHFSLHLQNFIKGNESDIKDKHLIKSEHKYKKLYPCKICGKNLADRASLQMHGRFHSGEKPYSCGYCDKKFAASGKVKSHEKTHTGEKPHCCKVCGKNFSELSNLKRHELLHTNDKTFF